MVPGCNGGLFLDSLHLLLEEKEEWSLCNLLPPDQGKGADGNPPSPPPTLLLLGWGTIRAGVRAPSPSDVGHKS